MSRIGIKKQSNERCQGRVGRLGELSEPVEKVCQDPACNAFTMGNTIDMHTVLAIHASQKQTDDAFTKGCVEAYTVQNECGRAIPYTTENEKQGVSATTGSSGCLRPTDGGLIPPRRGS